jgi:DNA repair exonuclease SbcCD nuclease subunit
MKKNNGGSKHIILGDIHLGKGTSIGKPGVGKDPNSRIMDQLALLEWVLDTAESDGISHIIITGDVYQDPKPHPALINYFMSWLKMCEKSGVSVDIIVGNHDIMRTGNYTLSALDLIPAVELPHARVFKDPECMEMGGICFGYLPYRDKRMYEAEDSAAALKALKDEMGLNIAPSDKKRNILVGHLALEGSLNITDEISDSLNEIFVPQEMLDGWDTVLMGHIHHPQVICTKRTGTGPTTKGQLIAHVGSMDRSDFHIVETDIDKIIYIVDEKTTETRTLPTRNLRKIDVQVPMGKDSTDFVNNAICLYDKKLPVKDAIVYLDITLGGETVPNVERDKVQAYLCGKLKASHICTFSETRNLSVVALDESQMLDKSMSVPMTIDKFADSRDDFDDEEQKQEFKELALDCNREYEEKLRK